jgi:hypothetical protein
VTSGLRRGGRPEEAQGTLYRCGPAARWLPRVLAATWLLAGLVVAMGLGSAQHLPFARGVQWIVIAAGGVFGAWTLRSGRETAVRVTVTPSQVLFAYGARESGVAFDDIERFAAELPLAGSRHLFPATVLRDRFGGEWRLPAVLADGAQAVREIVERSGRDDLRTWMDALRLERRMRRERQIVGIGYAAAAALLLAALAFWFR